MLGLLFVFSMGLNPVFCVEAVDDPKDAQIACAIVNGKLNDGPKCIRIQKKLVEERCKKGDPNACKALKVAKEGIDKGALEEEKKVKNK